MVGGFDALDRPQVHPLAPVGLVGPAWRSVGPVSGFAQDDDLELAVHVGADHHTSGDQPLVRHPVHQVTTDEVHAGQSTSPTVSVSARIRRATSGIGRLLVVRRAVGEEVRPLPAGPTLLGIWRQPTVLNRKRTTSGEQAA